MEIGDVVSGGGIVGVVAATGPGVVWVDPLPKHPGSWGRRLSADDVTPVIGEDGSPRRVGEGETWVPYERKRAAARSKGGRVARGPSVNRQVAARAEATVKAWNSANPDPALGPATDPSAKPAASALASPAPTAAWTYRHRGTGAIRWNGAATWYKTTCGEWVKTWDVAGKGQGIDCSVCEANGMPLGSNGVAEVTGEVRA